MRIQLVSDLHLEFRPDEDVLERLTHPDAAEMTLVVAGDLAPVATNNKEAEAFLRAAAARYRHVVYVLGNHEYYDAPSWDFVQSWAHALRVFRAGNPNLHVLMNSEARLDGLTFYGGTMWYRPIRDHRVIPGCWSPIYADNAEFLRRLSDREQGPDVVVSHHLPSMRCVDPQYANEPTNGYFVCNAEKHMVARQIPVWCFGHTHSPVRQNIGKTELYCNPMGYPGERSDWNPFFATFEI